MPVPLGQLVSAAWLRWSHDLYCSLHSETFGPSSHAHLIVHGALSLHPVRSPMLTLYFGRYLNDVPHDPADDGVVATNEPLATDPRTLNPYEIWYSAPLSQSSVTVAP